MAVLFVTSPESASGKTAVCAGIGQQLLAAGKKVGYFKPVTGGKSAAGKDAVFIKGIFALDEKLEAISPAVSPNSKEGLKKALGEVSAGKDAVIIEGESVSFSSAPDVATALGAKTIIVRSYAAFHSGKEDVYKSFGSSLLGVIVNKVPSAMMNVAELEASARLNKQKVALLGVLPEDRTLMGVAVSEVADLLNGEALPGGEDKSNELVENVMLSAMILDYGPDYFGRKDKKAVIIRSERPDMQLAALQTPVECMILTGDTRLAPVVIQEANKKNTPIILVKGAVPAAVAATIEEVIAHSRFSQPKKLSRMVEIMQNNLEMAVILETATA